MRSHPRGDDLVGEGLAEEAAERYRDAARLAPESEELQFWSGLSMMQSGELEEGRAMVCRVLDANDGWRQLLLRLSEEIAPGINEARGILGID